MDINIIFKGIKKLKTFPKNDSIKNPNIPRIVIFIEPRDEKAALRFLEKNKILPYPNKDNIHNNKAKNTKKYAI